MLVAKLDRDGLDCGQGASLYRCAFVDERCCVRAWSCYVLFTVECCVLYPVCRMWSCLSNGTLRL